VDEELVAEVRVGAHEVQLGLEDEPAAPAVPGDRLQAGVLDVEEPGDGACGHVVGEEVPSAVGCVAGEGVARDEGDAAAVVGDHGLEVGRRRVRELLGRARHGVDEEELTGLIRVLAGEVAERDERDAGAGGVDRRHAAVLVGVGELDDVVRGSTPKGQPELPALVTVVGEVAVLVGRRDDDPLPVGADVGLGERVLAARLRDPHRALPVVELLEVDVVVAVLVGHVGHGAAVLGDGRPAGVGRRLGQLADRAVRGGGRAGGEGEGAGQDRRDEQQGGTTVHRWIVGVAARRRIRRTTDWS
jgi:hypothetical protein